MKHLSRDPRGLTSGKLEAIVAKDFGDGQINFLFAKSVHETTLSI